MGDLSLKGVARRYRGASEDFSVINDVCAGAPNAGETVSLRTRLENLAFEEHKFWLRDGWLSWRAYFDQTWTNITVRVCLNFYYKIEADRRRHYRNLWENAIESFWSNQWASAREGELPCRLSFDVQWVERDYHCLVTVYRGTNRSTKYTWHTGGASDELATHEFGHMIGLVDEYSEPSVSRHRAVYHGTIMSGEWPNPIVPDRNMTGFANNIGSEVVPIPSELL